MASKFVCFYWDDSIKIFGVVVQPVSKNSKPSGWLWLSWSMFIASRPFGSVRKWKRGCLHSLQKYPVDVSLNTSIPDILICLVSLQRSLVEWWILAINEATLRTCGMWVQMEWLWQFVKLDCPLLTRLPASNCMAGVPITFYSLVYIPFKNILSLWNWLHADMPTTFLGIIFQSFLFLWIN